MQERASAPPDFSARTMAAAPAWWRDDALTCALLIAVLTLVRLIALRFSEADLYFDEAQYWAWAQQLEWGYFSKPPVIAWLIAAAEAVCGSGEACVRSPSPILYAGTALIVFALTRALYDRRIAFWAALALVTSTGAAFSARIISTDVPLLLFWSLALLALVKLARGGGWRWAATLGLALGLGLLSKYAMAYFFLCVLAAAFIDADIRRVLTGRHFAAALALALLILAPNLYWNATNGLSTFSHTVDNAAGAGLKFSAFKLVEFIGMQFAIAGPVVFAAFLIGCARRFDGLTAPDRLLLAFSVPVLLLIAGVAFATGAHPNWAAPALVAVTILAVAWLIRVRAFAWLAASFIVAALAQVLLLAGDAVATRVALPGLRSPDLYDRTLGWNDLAKQTTDRARAHGVRTVAAERRPEAAGLSYYLRAAPLVVRAWPLADSSGHYFEMRRPLDARAAEPILLITQCTDAERLRRSFAQVTRLAPIAVPTGPTMVRRHEAFLLSDRIGASRPLPPCG